MNPADERRCREAFEKAGYWPNEIMWNAWKQAWAAALESRPVRATVPIKVRPMLVSGVLATDDLGPVILLDSEQEPTDQVRAFWHEVLHLVGLTNEAQAELIATRLDGAFPSILRVLAHNINVPE